MIGQPNDNWFYDKSEDKIGVQVNGTRFIIMPDALGMSDKKWHITQAKGNAWKFKAKHHTEYASLPAWFQAAAPEWKHEFARITHIYRPVAWSSKAYEG
jgi:hypothetical protein